MVAQELHRSCTAFNIPCTKALLSAKREKYYIINSSWKQSSSLLGICGNSISLIVWARVFVLFLSHLPFILKLSWYGQKTDKQTNKQKSSHVALHIEFCLCLLFLSWCSILQFGVWALDVPSHALIFFFPVKNVWFQFHVWLEEPHFCKILVNFEIKF